MHPGLISPLAPQPLAPQSEGTVGLYRSTLGHFLQSLAQFCSCSPLLPAFPHLPGLYPCPHASRRPASLLSSPWAPNCALPTPHSPNWVASLPFHLLASFSPPASPTLWSLQPAVQLPNSGRDSQDKARKIRAIWEINRNWKGVGRGKWGGPRWWCGGLSGPTQFRECLSLLPPPPSPGS